VNHDLGLLAVGGLLVTVGLSISRLLFAIGHLHILITLALFLLVIIIRRTLLLEVLAASVAVVFLLSSLGAAHISVSASNLILDLGFGLLELLLQSSLHLGFFSTIAGFVVIQLIGFGLLGWILGGSGVLRVPAEMLASLLANADSGLPFDCEAGDSRLLCKYVATDTLDDGLSRRILVQLVAVVLVVDIVANAHELATIV
jgi:hypothetical protein